MTDCQKPLTEKKDEDWEVTRGSSPMRSLVTSRTAFKRNSRDKILLGVDQGRMEGEGQYSTHEQLSLGLLQFEP